MPDTPKPAPRNARRVLDDSINHVAALGYDPETHGAPKLVARGAGLTADKILELAKENDIPITRDPMLVSVLAALEIGAEIPPDLYGVIAEVLAWAYNTDRVAEESRSRRVA